MKIDRVIEIVRQYKLDEMMTAGAGGFTGSADAAGPVAGYDPVMEPPKKGRKHIKSPRRKPWLDYLKKKK